MHKIVPPSFKAKSFNCPHCHAYSHQIWQDIWDSSNIYVNGLNIAYCSHCEKYSLWLNEKMIYPETTGIQPPNTDLEEEIRAPLKTQAITIKVCGQ